MVDVGQDVSEGLERGFADFKRVSNWVRIEEMRKILATNQGIGVSD